MRQEAFTMAAEILFLDDDDDLRNTMVALFTMKFGVDCIGFASLHDLVCDSVQALKTRIAILDVNLGKGRPSGVDAFNWFTKQDFKGKIFFLTGHANSDPMVSQACNTGAEVWSKPMDPEVMFTEIDKILNPGTLA